MTLIGDILGAYKSFPASMRRQLAMEPREEKLLLYVVLACFIGLIARMPGIIELANTSTNEEVTLLNAIGTNIVSTMFYGPIMLYIIAALSHIVSKIFKGQGSFRNTRLALFWAVLVISPLYLALVALRPLISAPDFQSMGNILAGFLFIICWGVCLTVAEKFTSYLMTILSIVTIFGAISVVIRLILLA